MKFPVMQNFKAYVHYFFVPNRLLWSKWEDFITGGEDGLQEPDYPVIPIGKLAASAGETADEVMAYTTKYFGDSSLVDYIGFPNMVSPNINQQHGLDALPFRAYQLIYNEWYRDQNLSAEVDIMKDFDGDTLDDADGALHNGLMTLRQRAWKKDYFTSALPDPQRGPDVTLPLVGDMSIEGSGTVPLSVTGYQDPEDANVTRPFQWDQVVNFDDASAAVPATDPANVDVGEPVVMRGNVNAGAIAQKLTNSTSDIRSATINEVRRAFAVQRWYELAARAGSRYVEQILAHFGIRSSDARLQRPEYIGGGVVPVFIGDVLQTSETDGTPLGTPAGVGQAGGPISIKRRTFEEHGWILGILSIIPEAAYFQGIPRKYLKRDKFDFAWPLLANLGEQEIQKQELFFDPSQSTAYNKEGFGYAPRYSEYKFGSGQVHGDFRGNLMDFHDARVFDQRPALNEDFIQVTTPTGAQMHNGLNRIFAVRTGMVDHLWVHLYNSVKVRRVLPKYGTPI